MIAEARHPCKRNSRARGTRSCRGGRLKACMGVGVCGCGSFASAVLVHLLLHSNLVLKPGLACRSMCTSRNFPAHPPRQYRRGYDASPDRMAQPFAHAAMHGGYSLPLSGNPSYPGWFFTAAWTSVKIQGVALENSLKIQGVALDSSLKIQGVALDSSWPRSATLHGSVRSAGIARLRTRFFHTAGAEPRVPMGLDLGGLIRVAPTLRSERSTRVVPAIMSKSRRSSARHRARMPTPRATDYRARVIGHSPGLT